MICAIDNYVNGTKRAALNEVHTPIRPRAYFCLPKPRRINSFGSCGRLVLIEWGVAKGSGEGFTEGFRVLISQVARTDPDEEG